MSEEGDVKHYAIPSNVRSFVYLVGMLGFPVIIATYILVSLSADLKTIDKSLLTLASRIDERPMSVDKTSDFVIYVVDSMRNELLAGLPAFVQGVNLQTKADKETLIRDVNRLSRQIEAYVRPIVRKHQRFAERFPSSGGNIGGYFVISAPPEDISAGDTEAYLRGTTSKDFGESLIALMSNNILQFGNPLIEEKAARNKANPLAQLLGALRGGNDLLEQEEPAKEASDPAITAITEGGDIDIIEADKFLELSKGAIETASIALRDQILVKIKTQSSDFEKKDSIQDVRIERRGITER